MVIFSETQCMHVGSQESLSDELESWTPPLVNMVEDTVFPFCIAHGRQLAGAIRVGTTTDPRVWCWYDSVHLVVVVLQNFCGRVKL